MDGVTSGSNSCRSCGSPARPAICAASGGFDIVESRDGIELVGCPTCRALWARVSYEPYAASDYLLPWPWHVVFWRDAHDIDDGATLRSWHRAVLLQSWDALLPGDRAAAEHHAGRGRWVSTPFFNRFATQGEWDGLLLQQRTRLRLEGKSLVEIDALLPRRELPVPDLERLVPPT